MIRRIFVVGMLLALLMIPTIAQDDDLTLRVGHIFVSSTPLDPATSVDQGAFMYYDLIYDALLGLDGEGNLVPRLATDWIVTDESIILSLREGVTFSDGMAFDAEAAKANFDRYMAEGSRVHQEHLSRVSSVDVMDEFTLRLNLSERDEFLLERLSYYSGMMVSPDAFETATENPIGAGPYVLNLEESIEGNILIFDRNETYWDVDSLAAARIEIRIVPPTDVINGLLAGDQDLILTLSGFSGLIPPEQFDVRSSKSTVYGVMFWDRDGTIAPEIANQEVRCAISQAIDAESYALRIEGVIADPVFTMPPEGWYGYNRQAPITEYDPEAARATLAELGLEDLELMTGFTNTTRIRTEALIGFMNDIGVTVNAEQLNNNEYNLVTAESQYAVTALPFSIENFIDFVESFILAEGAANPFGVIDEDIEALYAEARLLSLEEAEPLYQEISALIMERCYIKPLAVSSIAIAFAPGVTADLRFRTNAHLDFRTVVFEN